VAVEYLYDDGTLVEAPSLLPTPRARRQGLWAGFALMLWRPYLELEGRYDWMDAASDPRQRFHAITAGLTGYAIGTLVKLQAAYSHKFHTTRAFDDDVLLLTVTLAGSIAPGK
jgi:hypothetical protein